MPPGGPRIPASLTEYRCEPSRNHHPPEATEAQCNDRWVGVGGYLWRNDKSDKGTRWEEGEAWHGRFDVDLSLGVTLEV